MKNTLILGSILLSSFAMQYSPTALAEETAAPSAADHAKHHLADAAKKTGAMKEPTPEMRVKMAEMHQLMADCLKSDKPMSECKKQMMDNCPMMKDGHCPMMGEMEMHGKVTKKGKKAADADTENHEEHH